VSLSEHILALLHRYRRWQANPEEDRKLQPGLTTAHTSVVKMQTASVTTTSQVVVWTNRVATLPSGCQQSTYIRSLHCTLWFPKMHRLCHHAHDLSMTPMFVRLYKHWRQRVSDFAYRRLQVVAAAGPEFGSLPSCDSPWVFRWVRFGWRKCHVSTAC
jgi:hypothetical protein